MRVDAGFSMGCFWHLDPPFQGSQPPVLRVSILVEWASKLLCGGGVLADWPRRKGVPGRGRGAVRIKIFRIQGLPGLEPFRGGEHGHSIVAVRDEGTRQSQRDAAACGRTSKVPRGGVRGTGWQDEGHRVILDGSDEPNKESRGRWPRTAWTFSELLRKRGVEGDVDFLREALQVCRWQGIIACPCPDTGDAEVSAQIGAQHGERNPISASSTATDPTAAEIGTPGWGRWSCAFPRSGRAAIFPACWSTSAAQ